ncbi:MAG: hypothetical protein CM15mP102_06130 [Flavobacteriales bacterium]|nr:MAG: hypothetical protein CM15mP102_06130 [Flavobacteriales bacterium]
MEECIRRNVQSSRRGATQPGADNPAQESAKDSKDDDKMSISKRLKKINFV